MKAARATVAVYVFQETRIIDLCRGLAARVFNRKCHYGAYAISRGSQSLKCFAQAETERTYYTCADDRNPSRIFIAHIHYGI
jgi:hypothetical protein